ncbi:MAG TPA: hypothetical protein VFT62_01045 [Mycobacteriales bacterium]|nr:hypothetical protein [Mycobacteriales bacterium]
MAASRHVPAAAALMAALTLAGCGTTVTGVTTSAGRGIDGESLNAPTAGVTGAGAVGTAGPGAGATAGTGGSTTGGGTLPAGTAAVPTSRASAPAPAVTGTRAGAAAGNGPGVTATTIYVGEDYEPDAATADAALGAAQANPGDTKAETEAVIRYINTHGGIAGRKISPIWYRANLNDSATTSAQQACALWTQDHKVFVLSGGDFRGASVLMDQCTAHEGGIQVNSGQITLETTALNAQFPADINLNGLTNDRAMGYTIGGLEQLNYFTSGARVGIATWDDSNFQYGINHVALPALARLGLRNVPVEYVKSPPSYGDLSATTASVSSAVLKFSQLHIDHVILFDGATGVAGGGILTLEWMQQAHSQHYNPRYGLNSGGGFNALGSALPADQRANSLGVSWEPPLDETSTDFAAAKLSPQAKLCQQIMDKAGQHVSTNNAVAIQFAICDHYFFLKHALDHVTGPLNQQTALAAINAVGHGYQGLVNFGVAVSAQRHDMPYLVRNMTYQQGCKCFRYVGGVYHPAG